MSPRALRLLFWGFFLLLCSAVLLSCVQERVGFSDFHEITCEAPPARVCRPTGRWVTVQRTVAAATAAGATRTQVVVSQFEADGSLIQVTEQSDCVVAGAQTFNCQSAVALRASAMPEATAQRWSMVHGHLQSNQRRADQGHFLNTLSLWRNRLLWGSFDSE